MVWIPRHLLQRQVAPMTINLSGMKSRQKFLSHHKFDVPVSPFSSIFPATSIHPRPTQNGSSPTSTFSTFRRTRREDTNGWTRSHEHGRHEMVACSSNSRHIDTSGKAMSSRPSHQISHGRRPLCWCNPCGSIPS